ncbi:MAG: hypothetical protein ACOX1A_09355 [Saccharofermentanales bacterium]
MFRPYDNIAAIQELKKLYPKLICIAYYLDSIRAYIPFGLNKQFHQGLIKRTETTLLNTIDAMVLPISCRKFYDCEEYLEYRGKIYYTDFPVMKKINYSLSSTNSLYKGVKNFLYAGTLDSNYRNPEIMFRVFMTMLEIYPDLVLHLFVKGNCNEVIEQYSKKSQGRIVNHGIVPHKELIEWLERSDVLINISNNMESVVPSKIF